jgi:hypothetical protein
LELAAQLKQNLRTKRVYIEFSAPARHLFGFNGGTF